MLVYMRPSPTAVVLKTCAVTANAPGLAASLLVENI